METFELHCQAVVVSDSPLHEMPSLRLMSFLVHFQNA